MSVEGVRLVFLAGVSVELLSVLIGTAINAVGTPLGAPGLPDNNRIRCALGSPLRRLRAALLPRGGHEAGWMRCLMLFSIESCCFCRRTSFLPSPMTSGLPPTVRDEGR